MVRIKNHPNQIDSQDKKVITAIIKIKIPQDLTLKQYGEHARRIAGNFQGVPSLIRKNFLFSDVEGYAGGIYTWDNKQAAKTFYAGPWLDNIREIFGVEPEITYYDTPLIVDNESGNIKLAT